VNQLSFNDEATWGQFATSKKAEVDLPANTNRLSAF
jgi:dynein heavy chain 2